MEENKSNTEKKPFIHFTESDVQRRRLDKLMNNIDKLVEIPDRKKEKKTINPPEFVRNVMGSSAGAGSGEFHVYRYLRRKEYARLNFIEKQARNEELDKAYHQKIEENQRKAEEATSKKRAKRLKKKEKAKKRRQEQASRTNKSKNDCDDSCQNSDNDEDDQDDEDKSNENKY
ncbi:PRKR-interacting protein 1 -like protein [Sarcoptes scabiei]|uniref:DUF1168 domain containing protein n=1 Tax=Sarcoptes scabiei TaxID=52283 RepID=A0A132AEH7_SARSC|nr:PRKR-interacting protein 1 -like protein [Sarcoptes scabiei]KPM09343.1 DUF1168 domain containing protein [Sarcoptes scabiei]UXI18108.1 hypothetical protein NH340_JMT04051 [Sarcoptes scabiei]